MRSLGRRSRRLVGLSSILVAALLLFVPTGSGAEAPIVVGWWYRDVPLTAQSAQGAVIAQLSSSPQQVPPITVPPGVTVPTVPPDVTVPDPDQNPPTPTGTPAGGLLVANDITGVRAIAAMRFDLPDAAGGVLRLEIAPGSTIATEIVACPSLSDWQPGPDQAWSRRPAHDCGQLAVPGTTNPDRTVMTWVLPDDFRDPFAPFYDVVLSPREGDGTPFSVSFDKPGADTFSVLSTIPDDATTTTTAFDVDDYDTGLPSDPGYFDDFFYDAGSGTVGQAPTDPTAIEPTVTTRPGSTANRLAGVLENPTARRIAALALILLGSYAYWQSNHVEQRAPRLLGSLGGSGATPLMGPPPAPPRGIGRFSRVRKAPPHKL